MPRRPPQLPLSPPRVPETPEDRQQFWFITLVVAAILLSLLIASIPFWMVSPRQTAGGTGNGTQAGGGGAGEGDQTGLNDQQGLNETGTETDGSTDTTSPSATPHPSSNESAPTASAAEAGDPHGDSSMPTDTTTPRQSQNEATLGGDEEDPLELGDLPFEQDRPVVDDAEGVPVGGFSQRGAKFFGVEGTGDKIAFVVDCSSSMAGYHRENYAKLEVAKQEMLQAINALTSQQTVTVKFFNTVCVADERFENAAATSELQEKLKDWLDGVHPQGGTEPWSALQLVIQGDYDLIYLVSDGEFSPEVVEFTRAFNKRRIMIHCISLGADSLTLQTIARQSRGQYREIKK